ncbi:MAG TPA: DUF3048 domain-containing protein, partial [Chloroflexi bacterium]|nr:DUF3048 domain-containing protein [Chloroflexota bacterium]
MKTSPPARLCLLMAATVILTLLPLVWGLAGCGATTTGSPPTPTLTPHPTSTPTPPPTSTPTPAFTPTPTPLPPDVNPLTGERVDDPSLLDRVPVAIKISNWPGQYVWPQAGIASADLIFEHYNEGWFATRWTAV